MSVISCVEIIRFDHPMAGSRQPGDGKGSGERRRKTKRFGVKICTEDGLVGAYVPLWSAPPYSSGQLEGMCELLVGRSIFEREAIWDTYNTRFAKCDRIAAGAIDIALWDAAGKATDLPISKLIGEFRTRLPAYVSTVGGGHGLGSLDGPESYKEFASLAAERGVRGFKLHGRSLGTARDEIALLASAAEGADGRMDLMTDPGKSLPTIGEALKLGRFCDEVGAFWWEDPMRDNAAFGHRVLREKVRTPLLLTEFVRGLDLRVSVAMNGGTDYLRADPELDMGITGVMKTAHCAEGLGIDMEVHASGPAQRHCMAAIRNTNYYELGLLDPTAGNPAHPDVYCGDYSEDLDALDEDGCVSVPRGPGLGIVYDWEGIESFNAEHVSFA